MRAAYFIRLVLIIGAAACVVVGIKRICEAVAYHMTLDPVELLIIALPFLPILMIAPRTSTAQKRFLFGTYLFGFIGFIEAVVIASNFILVLR